MSLGWVGVEAGKSLPVDFIHIHLYAKETAH